MDVKNEDWVVFMESAICALEDYGLNIRVINKVEEYWGIYVKDIQFVTDEELEAASEIGPVQSKNLRDALRSYYSSIVEEREERERRLQAAQEGPRKRQVTEDPRRSSHRRAWEEAGIGVRYFYH